MRKFIVAAVASLVFAGGAQAASVTNGSFEDGVDPGVFTPTNAGSTNITGWDVFGPGPQPVDYIGTYWTAQDGVRSIDLAGNSVGGGVSQTIGGLTAGFVYEVTFWISKNPDGGAPTRTGTIGFGGDSDTFSYSLINDRANMNWTLQEYRFTATGTSALLSFASDASGACCFGPALDNVSIAEVPEPATWAMMIGGFGLVGASMRRRRAGAAALA